MALLGTFINAGAACLATGLNCILHGVRGFQAAPDVAIYQLRSLGSASPSASIPILLESIANDTVIWRNANGGGVPGEHFVAMLHGIIR